MAWRAVAVRKAGAVVHVDRGIGGGRQIRIQSDVRRIALIVIESEIPRRGAEIREPAIDRPVPVGRLVRIGNVSLPHTPESRRADGEFVPLDQGTSDSE